ncbi:Oidioi.mRNA.OKI2018_I69.PAR.g10739.t1.cds [Oikopleura dioica]|uniref:Oidioi.mRNA.OKI2018_I69.PAR.g10457.t1.cds n=1 Tax=Oikopleura dioica TaxID=34765 RepID=A0ABN7RXQ3_OIKDI|nr:Oidioi.mRNA.OKI2018_I69.PAR.g10457.t1.cds [Oikopleura dioica]CAG5084797.1 Oidioi.mRNA.OKI2018_I69.PAR.g10739.t1.cds [Oikopleura dioica]
MFDLPSNPDGIAQAYNLTNQFILLLGALWTTIRDQYILAVDKETYLRRIRGLLDHLDFDMPLVARLEDMIENSDGEIDIDDSSDASSSSEDDSDDDETYYPSSPPKTRSAKRRLFESDEPEQKRPKIDQLDQLENDEVDNGSDNGEDIDAEAEEDDAAGDSDVFEADDAAEENDAAESNDDSGADTGPDSEEEWATRPKSQKNQLWTQTTWDMCQPSTSRASMFTPPPTPPPFDSPRPQPFEFPSPAGRPSVIQSPRVPEFRPISIQQMMASAIPTIDLTGDSSSDDDDQVVPAIDIAYADSTFDSLDGEQFQQIVDENDAQARAEEIRQLQSELENPSRGGTPDTIIDACLSPYLLGETLDTALSMGLITRETTEFIDEVAEMMEDEEDPPATVTPEKTFTEL